MSEGWQVCAKRALRSKEPCNREKSPAIRRSVQERGRLTQRGGQREFSRNILYGDDCRRLLAAADHAEEFGRGGVREAGEWEVPWLAGSFPALPAFPPPLILASN